jgi:hypothetical protein
MWHRLEYNSLITPRLSLSLDARPVTPKSEATAPLRSDDYLSLHYNTHEKSTNDWTARIRRYNM